MRQLQYIAFAIVLSALVSSCAKEELEHPGADPAMKSMQVQSDADTKYKDRPVKNDGSVNPRLTTEVEVNDDGDDENGNNNSEAKK